MIGSTPILKPAPQPGKALSVGLTVLVHGLLAFFLFVGVQWKQKQTAIEVEIWSELPREAKPATAPELAPVPEQAKPEPAPKPLPKSEPKIEPKLPEPKTAVKPDIAIRQEKDKKPPEVKKPEPPKDPPRDLLKEALEKELKQLNSQKEAQATADRARVLADQAAAEQKAAGQARGLANYAGKIRTKVKGNIILPLSVDGNPEAVFEVKQLPTGEILSVRLMRSSGHGALDAAIERAILKSSPLPKPDDPSLFQRVLEIRYRPFD